MPLYGLVSKHCLFVGPTVTCKRSMVAILKKGRHHGFLNGQSGKFDQKYKLNIGNIHVCIIICTILIKFYFYQRHLLGVRISTLVIHIFNYSSRCQQVS